MNDQTLIENAEHYAAAGLTRLARVNEKQAKRLTDNPEAMLDWSELRERARAQAQAMIGADLRSILDRSRADDPDAVDVHAEAIRRYARRSIHWVRTPTSTDATSNALDGILNDERMDFARSTGVLDY